MWRGKWILLFSRWIFDHIFVCVVIRSFSWKMKIINYHNLTNTNNQNNKYTTRNMQKIQKLIYAKTVGQHRDDTYKNFQVFSKNGYNVLCQCSNWLKLFNGIMPLFFSRRDSIPSRNFRWVHPPSLPTIFAFSHSISLLHVDICFASPPSFVFILVVAESMSPASMSCFVTCTLSWCS